MRFSWQLGHEFMMVSRNYRCLVYPGLAGVFLLVNWAQVIAQEEAVPVAAVVGAAEEGVADTHGGGARVEAWMNAFRMLSRIEAGRFVGVNPGTDIKVEVVQEKLLPVLRTLIETRDLLDREPDFDGDQLFDFIPPDLAVVFREAFGILRDDGKLPAGEVEKYLSDLELTIRTGSLATDLCGAYLFQQIVPITHSQSNRIINEKLFSKNAPPISMYSLLSIHRNSFDRIFELVLIPPVLEILGPEQKLHIDYIRELVGDRPGLQEHERLLVVQSPVKETEMPEENRVISILMQSYFETTSKLWQREYNLDKGATKKVSVSAREILAKTVELFSPEAMAKMPPMNQARINQLPVTHIIRQMPEWRKMVEKVSQDKLTATGEQTHSPMDDYREYVGICQKLNLYYILTAISVIGSELGGGVESEGLTAEQLEALFKKMEPLIHEDRFQDLPDFELFTFILNDNRDLLETVLNEKQMKAVEEMGDELSRGFE